MEISVVIPLFNEEESLKELADWIEKVMDNNGFSYEIIFVDDGSTDNSWKIIKELSEKNENIRGISFRRNYGKAAGLNEGFKQTRGNVVITMDADLQDSPEEIPELYRMIIDEDYDLVSGWKKKRFDPFIKRATTKLYNRATRRMTKIRLHDFNCGLKAYNSDVVKNIELYGEMHRYIPVIANWKGFSKIGEKVVQHQARKFGSTKYGFERFINGFLDLASITFVTRFGKKPMHFFGTMGSLSFFAGFIISVVLIGQKVYARFSKTAVERDIVDKPLFYIALLLVIIGVVLFLAGFLGELIHRISGDKNLYLIKDKINTDKNS